MWLCPPLAAPRTPHGEAWTLACFPTSWTRLCPASWSGSGAAGKSSTSCSSSGRWTWTGSGTRASRSGCSPLLYLVSWSQVYQHLNINTDPLCASQIRSRNPNEIIFGLNDGYYAADFDNKVHFSAVFIPYFNICWSVLHTWLWYTFILPRIIRKERRAVCFRSTRVQCVTLTVFFPCWGKTPSCLFFFFVFFFVLIPTQSPPITLQCDSSKFPIVLFYSDLWLRSRRMLKGILLQFTHVLRAGMLWKLWHPADLSFRFCSLEYPLGGAWTKFLAFGSKMEFFFM